MSPITFHLVALGLFLVLDLETWRWSVIALIFLGMVRSWWRSSGLSIHFLDNRS